MTQGKTLARARLGHAGGRSAAGRKTTKSRPPREEGVVRTQFLFKWRPIFRGHADDTCRPVAGRATDAGSGCGVSDFFHHQEEEGAKHAKKTKSRANLLLGVALAQFVSDGREIWRAHADEASQRGAARTCEVRLR